MLSRVKKCRPRFAGSMLSKGSTAQSKLFDCVGALLLCACVDGSIVGEASACPVEAAHSKSLRSIFRWAGSDKASKSKLNIDGLSMQFGGDTVHSPDVQVPIATSERFAMPCKALRLHCGQKLQ